MSDTYHGEQDRRNIILHGGPADGRQFGISEAVEQSAYLRIPMDGDGRTGYHMYMRRHMFAGQPGTSEFRDWYEWHFFYPHGPIEADQ
jgi:hypothetical protein